MEMVLALGSSLGPLFSTGTAAAAAFIPADIGAMAAAGAAVPAAAAGSAALGTLQGLFTGAQMIASIGAGLAGQSESQMTAEMLEADATSEGLASQQRALDIRRRALTQIADQRVAFAGSGVDISSGSPEALATTIEGEREHLLEIERENARVRQARSRLAAAAARSRGTAALLGGVVNAAGAGARYGIDIARRG